MWLTRLKAVLSGDIKNLNSYLLSTCLCNIIRVQFCENSKAVPECTCIVEPNYGDMDDLNPGVSKFPSAF